MVISGKIRALNNVLAEILRLNVHLRFRFCLQFSEDKSSRLMLLLSLVALFAFQTKAQNPPPPLRHLRPQPKPLHRLRRRVHCLQRNSWKTSWPESRSIPILCWRRYSLRLHIGTKFPKPPLGQTSIVILRAMRWQMRFARIICNGIPASWR